MALWPDSLRTHRAGIVVPLCVHCRGVSLTVLYFVWKDGARRGLGVWILYHLVLVGSFLFLFLVVVLSQMESTLGTFQDYWQSAFPPVASPLSLLGWMLKVHTSHSFAYPQGGNNGGSTLTLLLCLCSVGAFLRARRWGELTWLLVPFGLALLAAAFEHYPYGGKHRFLLFLSPLICTMVGVGIERLLCMMPESPESSFWTRGRVAIALLGILGAIGAGSIIRDLLRAGFAT